MERFVSNYIIHENTVDGALITALVWHEDKWPLSREVVATAEPADGGFSNLALVDSDQNRMVLVSISRDVLGNIKAKGLVVIVSMPCGKPESFTVPYSAS